MPLSAARARNEGFRWLRQAHQNLGYVQFVDGDCELLSGWLESATDTWRHTRIRRLCPGGCARSTRGQSIYNTLCDIEWDAPSGEARACGGIAMMRVRALDQVGGFRIDLIAGEEPELCVRLRGGAGKSGAWSGRWPGTMRP